MYLQRLLTALPTPWENALQKPIARHALQGQLAAGWHGVLTEQTQAEVCYQAQPWKQPRA